MKKLTKGAPIVEQEMKTPTSIYNTISIPKEFITRSGLKAGETLFFSVEETKPRLIIRYSRINQAEVTRPRKITGYNEQYRFTIPINLDIKHGSGSRWDCYEDKGDLYYVMQPDVNI